MMSDLRFDFAPLAVGTLKAPAERVITTAQCYVRQISMCCMSTTASTATRIWKTFSFVVSTSPAAAILARRTR